MYHLVYVSSATVHFSVDMLAELLVRSRRCNAEVGVSGMLLHKGGNFMQVLEGEKTTVQALFERISRDPRHNGALLLLKGSLAERQVPEWSMGFRDLGAADVHALSGYSEFLTTPLTGHEFSQQPNRCEKLLLIFKRDMR